jgi:hypothetical protein
VIEQNKEAGDFFNIDDQILMQTQSMTYKILIGPVELHNIKISTGKNKTVALYGNNVRKVKIVIINGNN